MGEAMRRFRDQRLFERDGSRFIWVRVADENGIIKRKSTRGTDEQAAVEWANEFERCSASPAYRRASETSFGEAVEDWLAEVQRRTPNEATIEVARAKSKSLRDAWSDEWPMRRIDSDLVLSFISAREKKVSPHTIKKELGALKGILEWARFRGTFDRELSTVMPPRYSSQHVPRSRWLKPDEATRLLDRLLPIRAAHVAYILATGARRGESHRARHEDVHLDELYVDIRGTKTKRAAGKVAITGISHPYIVFALQHAPGKDRLFSPWGNMVRDLAAACDALEIGHVSANDLRRTFGKWHRLAGVTAEQVSLLLRHTTDKLAQTTYGQISGADIGPALRMLLPIVSSTYAVSDPDVQSAQTGPNNPNETMKNTQKVASPAGFGPATPGLGSQNSADGFIRQNLDSEKYETRSVPETAKALVYRPDDDAPGLIELRVKAPDVVAAAGYLAILQATEEAFERLLLEDIEAGDDDGQVSR